MSRRTRRPSVLSILLHVALIGFGVWRLVGPRELSTGGLVWAWAMIAWGVIGLLLALVVRALPAASPEEGAKLLLDQQKQLYAGAHEYRRVTAQAFEGLDTAFYESTRTKLESLGFRYLGDVEDLTTNAAWPPMQAVLRIMAGDGGRTVAAVYHVRMFGVMRLFQFFGVIPRRMLVVDLGSELTSGLHVNTGNTLECDTTAPFPGISKRRFTMSTPVEVLLERHREHLVDALSANPGAQALDFHTLEAALESANRSEVIKAAHKAKIGYLDENEMKSVLQKNELDETDRQVLAEVGALQRGDDKVPPA